MTLQVNKTKYRMVLDKASKWIKQYVMMLVATYISFTVITNLLQMDQVGGVFVVSVGLFVIIISLLVYVVRFVRKAKKVSERDLLDKILGTNIAGAYVEKFYSDRKQPKA